MSFLAVAVGVRAGLGALFARSEARLLTWVAGALVVAAGLALGPLVQRAVFGTWWSGWPLGASAVDNRALVAGLAWAVAGVTMLPARGAMDRFARTVVLFATVLLIGAALLPRGLHVTELGSAEATAAAVDTR